MRRVLKKTVLKKKSRLLSKLLFLEEKSKTSKETRLAHLETAILRTTNEINIYSKLLQNGKYCNQ